jgi:hypothetical protein
MEDMVTGVYFMRYSDVSEDRKRKAAESLDYEE